MRTIGEIQAVVEDGRANSESLYLGATIEELALCVESQRIMLESLRRALAALIEAIGVSDPDSYLEEQAVIAQQVCHQADLALETTPEEWLEGV